MSGPIRIKTDDFRITFEFCLNKSDYEFGSCLILSALDLRILQLEKHIISLVAYKRDSQTIKRINSTTMSHLTVNAVELQGAIAHNQFGINHLRPTRIMQNSNQITRNFHLPARHEAT